MEEWKIYRLGDLVDFQNGYAFKSSKFLYDGKYKIIRIKELKNGLVKFFEDTVSISDEPNEILSKILVNKGDVIFALTGDPVSKQNANSWVGRVSLYTHDIPAYLNQRTCKIIQCNNVVPQYVYYYFRQYENLYSLASKATGSASQANISTKILEDTEILLPSLSVQKKMVAILASLDNKIALNRRINDNLEQQAQALFKSWFVDFEPFKDGKFVESEMGMIPEGWKYIKLGKLCESVSITHPQKTGKLIFLNTGDIECGMVNKHNYMNINEMPGQAKKSIKENDILYSEIRPCNKHYAFVNFSADEYIVSTKLMVIRTYNNNSLRIYQFLTRKEIIDLLQHEAESRSGTFPQIRFDNISDLDILLATEPIEKQYSHLISGIYNKIFKNELEISKLQQLRDCILPKLMSGELKINDLNC